MHIITQVRADEGIARSGASGEVTGELPERSHMPAGIGQPIACLPHLRVWATRTLGSVDCSVMTEPLRSRQPFRIPPESVFQTPSSSERSRATTLSVESGMTQRGSGSW